MDAYGGIGSERTPPDVFPLIHRCAHYMTACGLTLRSGGAPGSDTEFERAHAGPKEIFLPWRAFNGNASALFPPTERAMEIGAQYHPAWLTLSRAEQLLHGRNSHQVLGRDCRSPSRCIVCWTPGGRVTGGTGQALRIAADYNIPVVNLACYGPMFWSLVQDAIDEALRVTAA